MTTTLAPAPAHGSAHHRRPADPQQLVLAALLIIEIAVFAVIGTNFLTVGNALEIGRISVELGLLALALTPVIVSGGIDLSVGSMLALAAVLFGKFWRDGGMPVPVAATGALLVGALGGGLNAVLITRLRIPPLIVTLGSFSLFRGLAEGITGGVDNFTNFPRSYLFLGQGYIGGWVPAQLPIFIVAAVAFYALLHRTTVGRALCAIGFSPEGARHAGIPVERRLALVYVLSGIAAALAAIIYVARVGQAKADAGTGYELAAITAVVLGGTSIFGGTGSIIGTILGLFAIAVLQNGLRLADLPPELAGILTGVLLLLAVGLDWRGVRWGLGAAAPAITTSGATSGNEELDMRNSQLAVLSGVILAAALIVAAGNYLMVRELRSELGSARGSSAGPGAASADVPKKQLTVAMMPKSKGNAYFIACRRGAEEAARELGINLLWDGPTETDPAKQNEIVETWITRGVDVIAVAVENREGLSTALRKARERGIRVITWDADAEPDARDFFVNQATPQGIANTLMDNAARILGGRGEFAVITASLTAANQNEWLKYIRQRQAEKYPDITLAAVRPCDDRQDKAFNEAGAVLNANPNVRLLMAICSPAVPGAAEAVKQSGRTDVRVIGLGLPNDNKRYVHEGITEAVILWNTMDLGYLTIHTAAALHAGKLRESDSTLHAGRLGNVEVAGDNVLLGQPFTFTKENIDEFDF